MRISKSLIAAAAAAALCVAGLSLPPRGVGAANLDRDAVVAYNASIMALKRGDFGKAIPDLRLAADRGVFLAQYYLAGIYATPGQTFTSHPRAFELLRRLVAENHSLDPYLDYRAPFVARAELLLAYYYRHGVAELNVAPDPVTAKGHLEHAALQLGDTDAQFQLGRLDLENPETIARGLDTLDMLAVSKHHAEAAAEIAQIYNQGRFHKRGPYEALGYAMLAVKIATGPDRLEIGDIYQTIYCQTGAADRLQAKTFFDELEQSGREDSDGEVHPPRQRPVAVEGLLDLGSVDVPRECANGEAVPVVGSNIPVLPSAGQPVRSFGDAAAHIGKGFTSLVGFIGPRMGLGLKDLEQPRALSDDGEPLSDDAGAPSN